MNLFLEFLVAIGIAALLHEATHWIVARLLGRHAVFSLRDFSVNYEASLPPGPAEYLIAGSPLFIGLPIGLVWLLLVGVPSIPVVFGWAFYTLLGAVTQDFSFERSRAGYDQSN